MMSFADDVAMWNWQQKLRDPLTLLLLAALTAYCEAIARVKLSDRPSAIRYRRHHR